LPREMTDTEKPKLRKPKFTKVKSINPDSTGVNVYLKVLSCDVVPEKEGATSKLAEVRAGDDSGAVTLRVRDDQIETCKVGSSIVVQNGTVQMFRGYIRLEVDKWGKLRAANGEHAFTVKEDPKADISATEYELVDPKGKKAGKGTERGSREADKKKKKPFDAAAALHNTSKDHDGAVKLYDDWADTYDDSLNSWGYEAPQKIAEKLWENVTEDATTKEVRVMDCGCGTGMSGEAIVKARAKAGGKTASLSLVGTDCSAESLKLCMKKKLNLGGKKVKVYQQAEVVNLELKQEIFADDSFDAVTCVGTTSYLHDFNMIFGEWCRFTKKGGKIVFTHRTNIWDSDEHQVQSVAKQFEADGKWKRVSMSDKCPYMPKNPVAEEAAKTIYYCVYEVL